MAKFNFPKSIKSRPVYGTLEPRIGNMHLFVSDADGANGGLLPTFSGGAHTVVEMNDGNFIHRDHWLEDDEKASGKKILPCVSRFEGNSLILDR